MNSVAHDSELLTHHVAAVAVPGSMRFIAVRDENNLLMIFSIGTDSKIYVSKINQSGQRIVCDFGQMLGLSDKYRGHAIDVTQDPASSTLFIAVATSLLSGDGSAMYILRPFRPSEADLGSPITRLTDFIIPESGGRVNPRIFSIYMGKSTAKVSYPSLLFAYQTEIHKSEDLNRADITCNANNQWQWTRRDDVMLPENAARILAVQAVTFRLGTKVLPGFVTLYKIQDDLALVFRSLGVPHPFVKELEGCPPEACDISTVLDSEGYSDLLVGGLGLYRFKGTELAKPRADLISKDGVFASVKALQATQSSLGISVWAENLAGGIGYLEAAHDLSSPKSPIQVIPDGAGGYFCPLKATETDSDKFIASSNSGSLSLLEQDSVSGLWKATPLMTPALNKIVDVPSYMTQIQPLSATGMPLLNSEVNLQASGDISIIVNGRPVVASPRGLTVETDHGGYVTLVIPTEDISSTAFTVSVPEHGAGSQNTVSVDPSHQVHERLANTLDQHNLEDVILPSGKRLMEGTSLSKEEIHAAADTIKAALKRRKYALLGPGDSERQAEEMLVGYNLDELVASSSKGISEMFWDSWHWLERQTEKIVSYAIKGAEFFVRIAGITYKWIMETVTQISKAISWLIKKVLDLAEKVIEWLGFLFSWEDINAAKESIVNVTNDGIDWANSNIWWLKGKADAFFEHLETSLSGDARPQTSELDKVNGSADDEAASRDADKNVANRSVMANWTRYQFEHGGARDGAVVSYPGDPDGSWDGHLQAFHDNFVGQVTPLQTQLVTEYDPKGKRSIHAKSAFEKILENFLTQIVNGMKTLTDSMFDGIEKVLSMLKDFLNAKIDIPVFSALYKRFTGSDLSVLNVMALIIAIPGTIISKLAGNEALPTFKAGDYKAMVDNVVHGTSAEKVLLPFNVFANIAGVAAMGITMLCSVVSFGSIHAGRPPTPSSPTAPLAGLAAAAAKRGDGKAFNWGVLIDTGILILHLIVIPTDDKLPSHVLRLASWLVSMLASLVAFSLHLASKFIGKVKDKIRAVVDIIFEIVMFSLEVTVRVDEVNTPGWEGKDDDWSKADCGGHVGLLLGISGGALKTLAEGTPIQPYALAAQIVGLGAAIAILGTHGIISFTHKKSCDPPRYVGPG